jgi:hypothetical protein
MRDAGVRGVPGHGAHDFLWPPALPQDFHAPPDVIGLGWVTLVVKVVQQADDPPHLFVLAEIAGIGPHSRLYSQSVLDQIWVLGELGQELPSLLAGHVHRVPPSLGFARLVQMDL